VSSWEAHGQRRARRCDGMRGIDFLKGCASSGCQGDRVACFVECVWVFGCWTRAESFFLARGSGMQGAGPVPAAHPAGAPSEAPNAGLGTSRFSAVRPLETSANSAIPRADSQMATGAFWGRGRYLGPHQRTSLYGLSDTHGGLHQTLANSVSGLRPTTAPTMRCLLCTAANQRRWPSCLVVVGQLHRAP
jgi:hypothetical protein